MNSFHFEISRSQEFILTIMSIYYDAATVLGAESRAGSLKSRIYDNKLGLGSKPTHLYALISEAAKYDTFLKQVIDASNFLVQEPKVGNWASPLHCLAAD